MSRMMTHSTSMFAGRTTYNPRFGMTVAQQPTAHRLVGSSQVLDTIEAALREAGISVSRRDYNKRPQALIELSDGNNTATIFPYGLPKYGGDGIETEAPDLAIQETAGRVCVRRNGKDKPDELALHSISFLHPGDTIIIGDKEISI